MGRKRSSGSASVVQAVLRFIETADSRAIRRLMLLLAMSGFTALIVLSLIVLLLRG